MRPSTPRPVTKPSAPEDARITALSETHAVHEAGYEVSYTGYSVTYRDSSGEKVVAAEVDEEGRLLVHSRGSLDAKTQGRVERLLKFLGAHPVFD